MNILFKFFSTEFFSYLYTLLYLDRWSLLLFLIALFGVTFFRDNLPYFIISYAFFFIGLLIMSKRHPIGSLLTALVIIFLGTVYFWEITHQYEILTAGITLILVVITGFYSMQMFEQTKMINNEKLGKIVVELSRVIFIPLKTGLIEFKMKLDSGSYIIGLYPTHSILEKNDKNILNHFLYGEIEVYTEHAASIKRPARLLLKNFNDDELKMTLSFLEKKSTDFENIINELINLHKLFDADFLPYWIPFKEECKRLDQNFDINYDPDFKQVLKSSFIQQDYIDPLNGRVIGHHEDLPGFIHLNRENLHNWLLDIPQLKVDIEKINKKKMSLIIIIDQIIPSIEGLLSSWRFKYYLTEAEIHPLNG